MAMAKQALGQQHQTKFKDHETTMQIWEINWKELQNLYPYLCK